MSSSLHPVWRDYRARQCAVVIAAASLGGARLATFCSSSWVGVAPLVTAGSATACVAALVWFASFRCPFCANHFHWTWLVSNPFAARCLHCGFEKLRDPEAGRAYAPVRPRSG